MCLSHSTYPSPNFLLVMQYVSLAIAGLGVAKRVEAVRITQGVQPRQHQTNSHTQHKGFYTKEKQCEKRERRIRSKLDRVSSIGDNLPYPIADSSAEIHF